MVGLDTTTDTGEVSRCEAQIVMSLTRSAAPDDFESGEAI
jgi:hypothetical protein